ncbi:MAG: phenylalanine--tRNA ligase beta subunit-related protein [Candidatus Micrarchaeota archaeon]|nr:phenylalanine--tRNA ligase beta subunit-related protein [Candidatus Micrarchaeota archaeon]
MAQVQITHEDLNGLISVSKNEAIETLTMLGFPTEVMEDGRLNVEVTPNRPDALCVEGIARVLECYKSGKPSIYEVAKPEIEVAVDRSVESVRPAFGCAVVRRVPMNDALLKSLMQLQEKLHETLGRKRRKVAIGIHDIDKVKPPFRYFACGREEIKFVPLERTEEMTPLEILKRHEKGMAYAHLVSERCPMITDAKGDVLSFPPIINGELTKLTVDTINIFIDCTGTSHDAVKQAVNLVASFFQRWGTASLETPCTFRATGQTS